MFRLPFHIPQCAQCACENDYDRVSQNGQRRQAADADQEICIMAIGPMYAPKMRGYPTYSSEPDQPLLGVPIREGCLLHLSTQDNFEPVAFQLYVNGFAFSTHDGLEASVSLSPFSLVRNCRFQSGECSKLKSFKVSLLDHDPCCYFAVRKAPSTGYEREAEEERSEWVLGISHTILLITDSLLPDFPVTCDPIANDQHTSRRLMAGYLIHRDDASSISVLFCELNVHSGHCARMVLYENETCTGPLVDIVITQASICCDIVGINCSCFAVGDHHFAAQTPSERKLWLRALSNVKVKIQNNAPEPTEEDMAYYREAVREQIYNMQATSDPRISSDPLLSKKPRNKIQRDQDAEPDSSSIAVTDDVATSELIHLRKMTSTLTHVVL